MGSDVDSGSAGLQLVSVKPALTETAISRKIAAFLRSLGCKVYVISRNDPRGSRTTKGLPDMLVIIPRMQGVWTWAEIKGDKGKLRPDQVEFRDLCRTIGIPWELWRSLDDATAWAKSVGLVA